MNTKPITVVVMTYNQRRYIKQALDSILCQQIDIDFDVLIHDDCSDDGTYEILLEYQKLYPDKIKIIHQSSRVFLIDGFNIMIYKYVVPHIHSKYVAYCDGDDYWCNPLKLKKQYDFLESHPDYSMCFHSAYQLRQNNDLTSSQWFVGEDGDIDISNLINDKPGTHIATSSVFIKSDIFKDFSEWRKLYPVEDIPLYLTAALYGKIHRLPERMCVYRQFAMGSYTTQMKNNEEKASKHARETILAVKAFDRETSFKYHDLVILQIERYEFRIALANKDFNTIFSKKYKRFIKRMSVKERFALKLQYRHPKLYNLMKRKQ